MAVGSVSSVVNSTFLARFSGSGGSAAAASGNFKFSSADQVSTTLSTGTRTLTAAYQGLGQVIGVVNGTLSILDDLGKIAEDVVELADSASRSTSSAQRAVFATEYQRLGSEFKKVVEEAKLKNLDLLSEDDIAGVLKNVGLNPDGATAITEALKRIITTTSDNSLADSAVKDQSPVRVPTSEAGNPAPTRYEDVFSPQRTIRSRGDAMVLKNDAKMLLSNIKTNTSALTDVRGAIVNNMDLVRATALAFRAESRDPATLSITSADALAARVQGQIFKIATPRALREAGNLNSIVSAALLYA
jgi:flagellin-like hook-associated protein FlgL